ncbi:MAG: [acyl-carrier-protein] S-malonyltransferase [Dictyoglomus sp. NZ13-RE01]|nr:MAG: [acyl-carrier-protein] S-malonyltransferase [Dictyoglomus sp. NZ13-RE01]
MRAFIFPGQGSQSFGMFSPFLNQDFEYFLEEIRKIDENIIKVYQDGTEELMRKTIYSQPAIFSISCMLDYYLKNNNFYPDFVTGHSLGEYSAFCSAGIFDFSVGLRLVYERGRIMQEISEEVSGGMWAVIGGDIDKIRESLKDFENLFIANYNSHEQIIISGSIESFQRWQEIFRSEVKRIIPLSVSGPFHSPLMGKAQDKFWEIIKEINFRDPEIPVISSTTVSEVEKAEDAKEILLKQFTSSVFWTDTISKLNSLGVDEYIEVGPGKVLQGLVKKILKDIKIKGIEKPEDFLALKGEE